jgi:hypothetical protein
MQQSIPAWMSVQYFINSQKTLIMIVASWYSLILQFKKKVIVHSRNEMCLLSIKHQINQHSCANTKCIFFSFIHDMVMPKLKSHINEYAMRWDEMMIVGDGITYYTLLLIHFSSYFLSFWHSNDLTQNFCFNNIRYCYIYE